MDLLDEPGYAVSTQLQVVEGPLDVHPSKTAIVVRYGVEAMLVSGYGQAIGGEGKTGTKIINIKNLTSDTNIKSLARHIVSQTSLINPMRLPEVEQLLVYLLSRKKNKKGFEEEDILSAASGDIRKQMEDLQPQTLEKASMMDLDSYLESVYEDLAAKVEGTAMILQLARIPDNLLQLSTNNSMFLALTRVLRDDFRKSIELSTNIIYTFFCFSTFSNFHPILIQHKVGSLCMTLVDHELTRHQLLLEELEKKRREVRAGTLSATAAKQEYEKAKKKFSPLMKKHETLLRVCLYLLLNLAESPMVEQKMRNKGIISQLMQLLDRDNQDLLILVVSFLKKMSIYADNKEEMAKEGIIRKVVKMLPCDNGILVNVTLRLLVNLSFDPTLREEIVKLGLLPKLVALLGDQSHRGCVMLTLYHISMDDKGKAAFACTECVPMLMKLLLQADDSSIMGELGLAVNLSCHALNAQLMCQGGSGLRLLMKKALQTKDPFFMKLIRNISQHNGPTKILFVDYLGSLVEVLRASDSDDLKVEVLGILGNVSIPDLDYAKVVKDLALLPLLADYLKGAIAEDDILLETVLVCATIAQDEVCAQQMVQSDFPQHLLEVLKAKQNDDEIVLQIANVLYMLLLHKNTQEIIINDTEVPDYLLELFNDKNKAIQKVCAKALNIIVEYGGELAERIRTVRFRTHNTAWIEMVTGSAEGLLEEEEEDEDYMDPHYLHMAADLDSLALSYGLDTAMGNVPRELLQAISPSGRLAPPPPSPLSPGYAAAMMYDDDPLAAYGVVPSYQDDELEADIRYSSSRLGHHAVLPSDDALDFSDHPAFSMLQSSQPLPPQRPPSRMNF